jgi:hypothetical protein
MEAYRVVRYRGSHIVETISSQVAVKLSAFHASNTLLPERPNAITSSGVEPTTYHVVA